MVTAAAAAGHIPAASPFCTVFMKFHKYKLFAIGFLLFPGNSSTSRAVETVAGAQIISLEHAYDRALASDQSIRRAYWEIRKANLEPLSALTRLGPSITGSSNLARSDQATRTRTTQTVDQPVTIGVTGSNSVETTTRTQTRNDTGAIGITYEQTILDLTAIPAFRLGKLTAQAARLTYRETIREVLFSLADAYYEVLKQQRIVLVSRETVALAQQQLELAQTRAGAGEVLPSDVLSARVTVESGRRTLIEAENSLASDRNKLANILNLPTEAPLGVVEPPPFSPSLPSYEALFARALERREDLRVKAIAIEQDVQRRAGVIAEYAPKVVVDVNADANRSDGSSRSRSESWDATISVQVPFFTGGQREIDLAQKGHQIRQTRLDYETAVKNMQQDVKDAWLQVRTLEATLKTVRIEVESGQEAYEELRAQYQAGTATSVDVLNALNNLNIARRDLATQTYDYQVALRKVELVTGAFQEERVQKLKFK